MKDLVTFTEEILNGKLHFLCSVRDYVPQSWASIGDMKYKISECF